MHSSFKIHVGVQSSQHRQTRMEVQHELRPFLVDVTEELLSYPLSAIDRINHNGYAFNKNKFEIRKILWYNKPRWISLSAVSRCLKTCVYKNCESVTNISLFSQSSAVIFCTTTTGIEKMQPIKSTNRRSDQAWVFFAMESPLYMDKNYKKFHPQWKNSFNWSMNYRLDSDINVPYGYLSTRNTSIQRNYTKIFKTKTKLAAWVVSHCKTFSGREVYVDKMRQYGLDIDIFGACGQRVKTGLLERINKYYKFYLGFENAICSDYITEKFFRYYNLNTIVIVRGGANYKRLLPNDTYINTADFKSIKQLVHYLKYVSENETLYTAYLKRKDAYLAIDDINDMCPSFCALCGKVNNLDKNRRVYRSVPTYMQTCQKPGDLTY